MKIAWKQMFGASLAWIALSAAAQTAVTTTGGIVNTLAKFGATTAIVNSAIFESSGHVGIGNTNPYTTLDVTGIFHLAGAGNAPTHPGQ